MDWLNDNVWLFWIGVALVLAAIEAATVDFVFIMFAGGALAAAVAAGLGASFPVQVVVAVGVAVLGAVMTAERPDRVVAALLAALADPPLARESLAGERS